MPLLICLIFVLAHAGLYFAVLRDAAALASEKGIFLYHFISAILLAGGFGLWAASQGDSNAWTWFACAIMLHGLYSVSLLELWALADDSYSVAILEIIDQGGPAAVPALMQRLEEIGMCKQSSRLDALRTIGLVRDTPDGSVALTPPGRAAVVLGRLLLFLVDARKYG